MEDLLRAFILSTLSSLVGLLNRKGSAQSPLIPTLVQSSIGVRLMKIKNWAKTTQKS